MSTTEKHREELLKALDNPSEVCRIELFNNTAPADGVRIIAAGARFDYQDGSTLQRGPVEITVDAGQSVYFLSDNKCVRYAQIAVTVVVAGQQGSQNLSGDDTAPDQSHCLISCPFSLVPQAQTDRSAYEKGDRSAKKTKLVIK